MPVTLGCLDGELRATVDGRGRVRVAERRWSLGWAVRADDGWHVADTARSSSSTQRRVDGAPVVETALRVPSGQAVHRAFAARAADGTEAVVVEVENRSRSPIAAAFVVDGARRISVVEAGVEIDGRAGLRLPRVPSRIAASLDELVADGGTSGAVGPNDVRSRRGHGQAALVLPLAHTACLRVVVGAPIDADRLPGAGAVAAGWAAHLASGLRLAVPDAAAVAADLAELLLADVLGPTEVRALDRFGHHGLADRALWMAIDGQRLHDDGGAWLLALAEHCRLSADRDLVEAAVGPVAAAAHRLRRTGDASVQLAAAALLDAADEPDAADLCRSRAHTPQVLASDRGARATRSGARSGEGPAARLLGLRAMLVADRSDGVELAPAWPDDWLGRGVEVHRAPTRWGRLSYAIRWHGARPALLWELDGPTGARLTCGLDPAWLTTTPRGDALLAPVEPPGGLPAVVAPLPERGTPVDEADADGPGFS